MVGGDKMKASEFDVGSYLNAQIAQDLNLIGKDLRIHTVRRETIRGVVKMLMTFTTAEKGLVVNKTNRAALVAAFGGETDDWNDRVIRLQIGQVMFQGRMVPSIIVQPIAAYQAPVVDAVIDAEKPKKGKKP
jgi:hypothetical protein